MIETADFVAAAARRGFDLFSGVPCSYLTPFINYVINDERLQYVAAANEGDAVAVASGAALCGGRGAAMFQNSGLGNAVNPLTSLNHVFDIPILLIVTWRGQPGVKDEPQHALMGRITTDLLDVMEIPWELFPQYHDDIDAALDRAVESMDARQRPYALVMQQGSVAAVALERQFAGRRRPPAQVQTVWRAAGAPRARRKQALEAVLGCTSTAESIVIASTGYTGRELYALDDRPNHFYMVGSMGCASSLGLGVALRSPHKRVVVVEGDGAVLMRMGAMATIGFYSPQNLVHVVLDNEVHDSTGGQATISGGISLAEVAQGCGYAQVYAGDDPQLIERAVRCASANGARFVHLKTQPGAPSDLPRPTVSPVQVKQRLASQLSKAA